MDEEPVIPASLKARLDKYERAHELKMQGLSNREIGRVLGVDQSSVLLWLRGVRPKRVGRYEPDLRPGPDLAYLAGFYIGDGRKGNREHKVGFTLADEEQAICVNEIIAKLLGRSPRPVIRQGPFFVVDYDSVVLSNYLNQSFGELAAHLRQFIRFFIRGFADAEGYVSPRISLSGQTISSAVVGIVNTRISYLRAIKKFLSSFGVSSAIHRTNKKGSLMTIRGRTFVRKHDVFHLTIEGFQNVRRFRDRIGLLNPNKSERLRDLVSIRKLTPQGKYVWFTTYYRKEGRKWRRIAK